MNTFIYHKDTLNIVGMLNAHTSYEKELELNVFPNFGGNTNDYDIIETEFDYITLEKVDEIVKAKEYVIPVEPQEPTETELLNDYIIDVDYRVTMIELGL
ncbi:hypothetical protein [Psychrobacillus vulpis]|uniref:Uncharacterized protein n=1 Tax=Psychrobacillus vulpis TaxID=2325572 RepID=A0A544TWI6_9BACI|nr:hypothetical protein [Psychrobacillus vulpis]TQR21787.1 hypothetical protein FG384_02240 [Psychrobacillus vulpis]